MVRNEVINARQHSSGKPADVIFYVVPAEPDDDAPFWRILGEMLLKYAAESIGRRVQIYLIATKMDMVKSTSKKITIKDLIDESLEVKSVQQKLIHEEPYCLPFDNPIMIMNPENEDSATLNLCNAYLLQQLNKVIADL